MSTINEFVFIYGNQAYDKWKQNYGNNTFLGLRYVKKDKSFFHL